MSLIATLITELSFSTGQRIDQTVQYIRNNGIDIGEEITDTIGSGDQGRIYATSNPTKVIKFEEIKFEKFEDYKTIQQKNPKYIVRIFMAKYVNGMMCFVMERLVPFDGIHYFEGRLDSVLLFMEKNLMGEDEVGQDDLPQFYERFKKDVRQHHHKYLDVIKENLQDNYALQQYILSHYNIDQYVERNWIGLIKNLDMLVDIQQGVYELRELGIRHGDLHANNIMKDKNGTHKIIDLF